MTWLVTDGRVLASADVVRRGHRRHSPLTRREGFDGAVVRPHCRWVHTVGTSHALDVAYLDHRGAVIKVVSMAPRRIGTPVVGARTVILASAGAFGRWGLHLGDVVDVTD
jgi:hypothetical protein